MRLPHGFSLVEVVVATTLLLLVVLVAAPAGTGWVASAASASRWRQSATEVGDLVRRFERAPCALGPRAPAAFASGGITYRWSVVSDSGRLEATEWPGDAPLAVRRGQLRSVLPCA